MFAWLREWIRGHPGAANAAHRRGRVGEELAAQQLRRNGFRIIERNWRCPLGELDLVATKGALTVLVEVKTSRRRGAIPPEMRVNGRKRMKLRSLADYYLKRHRPAGDVRFDIIAVWWDLDEQVHIDHIENAFC